MTVSHHSDAMPWEYPIASLKSRAAARAVLDARERNVKRLQVVISIPAGLKDNSKPHVGPWQPMIKGGFMRVVYIPPGTEEETERRILATP
jgi:hypothetical protein